MQIPAVFEQDIQSQSFSIVTRVIIGYTDPIYLSTHSLNFEGNYYKPLLLGIPSMKESVDYESRNFKISNVTLKISNYEHDGERFSDSFRRNPLINQQCEIYWNSQSATSSSDTLRIFKGYVRRVNHTDSQVSIQIEDLTEKHLHKTLPIERTSNARSVDSKYRDVPIPIAFGELPFAPAVLDVGRVVKADSDETIELMTSNNAPQHPVWGDFSDFNTGGYTPLSIKDGNNAIYIPKEVYYQYELAYDGVDSPSGHIQYDDYSEQVGALKLTPFRGGGVDEEIIEMFQVYGLSKADTVECRFRSSQSYKNHDGIYFSNIGETYALEGWTGTQRFRPLVAELLSDDDYTFNSLTYLNGGDVFNYWDTAAGGSTHFDYDAAINTYGGVWRHGNQYVAQGLIRIEIPFEPQFSYVSKYGNAPNHSQDLSRTAFMAINGVGIPWTNAEVSTMVMTRTLNAAKIISLASKADSLGTTETSYHYLDGQMINESTGANDGSSGVDYRNIFQHIVDGEVDSSTSYRGHTTAQDGLISLVNVRRTVGGTAASEASDFGAFIRLRCVHEDEHFYEIVIGDYTHAGEHEVEFEGGLSGDWSEIDLLHNVNIEFSQSADYYLGVKGRKDGGTTLRNPIEILRHLAINELGLSDNDIDTDSYNTAKSIHGTYKFDFSIKDEIGSKELFEQVAKSTLCYPYFNNQGKLTFPSYKSSYSEDDYNNAKVIKDFDVINFSFNRTKLENVYTACRMKYDYDYTTDKYDKILLYNASEMSPPNLGIYNMYQNEAELAYNGYSLITDNILEFESPYIKDGETAGKVWQYMYRDSQFQHLTCKIKLPLKYIHLDVGDYIRFDKLLGGMKAFGIDYTRLVTLITEYANSYVNIIKNGAIYPMFFITSVNKNLDSIEIEARQMHHLDGTDINNLDFWGWDANEMSSVNAQEQDDDEEELYDDSELGENEYSLHSLLNPYYHHPIFFRTVNSHPSSSLEFWTAPQSFGTGNFMVFVPHPMPSTFNYLDILNYVIFEFKIAIFMGGDDMLHHATLRLRNVGGSVADPDSPAYNFELGWTTEITRWDGEVVLNEAETPTDDAWSAFFDEDYTVVGDDLGHLGDGHHLRAHTIELGEGFKEALWRQVYYGEELFEWNPQYTDLAFHFNSGVDSYRPPYGYGLGDANGDGNVNIFDIVKIVNYILGSGALDNQERAGADANQDGTVNITDIVLIVNYILGHANLGDD